MLYVVAPGELPGCAAHGRAEAQSPNVPWPKVLLAQPIPSGEMMVPSSKGA